MTNCKHAFNPEHMQLHFQKVPDMAPLSKNKVIKSRDLFYQLNQPEKYQDILPKANDFISYHLKEAERVYSSFKIQEYCEKNLESLKTSKITPLAADLFTQENLLECVKQTTAILLTQPCWLQNISQISCCKTLSSVQLMSLYLQITRTGEEKTNLLESYRSLLLATHIGIPILYSDTFSQQSNNMSKMIDFATIQLALSRFPRVLFPEILGFTLAYCQLPTLIEICFPDHSLPFDFFKLRHKRLEKQLSPLLDCIKAYLNLFPQQTDAIWRRLQNGFWLYQLQMERCRDQFNKHLENPLSWQQTIVRLFQKKASAAMGHHQKIQLQGQSLDSWFSGMPENNREFLHALKHSRYVNLDKPEDSLLLKLFDFKGPMFGVLVKDELDIIKNWLKAGLIEASANNKEKLEKPIFIQPLVTNTSLAKKYEKLSNRELYYYLLNADLFPDVFPVAQVKIRRLLRWCAFFNSPPFKHYNHEQFESYIENIYQQEISAYQSLQGKPKISKEAYIWGIKQIAPMILIDGCWLQNSLALQTISPEISEILFSIYCDEVGNGQQEQNHPYIFQQLLDSLSIKVPPVHTKEFVDHSGFINSAFDLPAYMLALSSFSVEFLPELLGLNMAIELSGLGKGYMQLIDEWNYWGIDSTIASIHVSIDNAASGHTFLAKKAIQLYMDNMIQHTGDQLILDRHWRRLYCGYASLRFIGGRFKLGLPINYLMHKFKLA